MPLLPLSRRLLVKCSAGATVPLIGPLRRLYSRFLHTSLRKSPSRAVLFALKSSGFRPPRQLTFTTTREVHHAPLDAEMDIDKRFKILREKLEELGFNSGDCKPGQYTNKMCPKCEGGESKEKSLSLYIREDGRVAMWTCFRENCSWRGCIQDGKMLNVGSSQTLKSKKYRALTEADLRLEPMSEEDGKMLNVSSSQTLKSKKYRTLTEADLRLEPLSEETLAYFKKRMISTGTLQRNAIMQRRYKTETVIAFPYRRNGMLVSCKYRGIIDKKFRQESNTERVFYGLDDIRDASEIIIVEGEMDKLAMEEAGYPNCVSVPDGAPGKVSENLPDEEKDTKFQYLWNCEEYLNQASRIILATDADAPGQALAEELARRLGKERCWRVNWPTESGQVCKDANEVLMHKGLDALREVIENAEFYPIGGLFNFSSFFPEIDDYYYCRNGFA